MSNILVDHLFNEDRTEINESDVLDLAGEHLHGGVTYEQAVEYAIGLVKNTNLSDEMTLINNFIGYFSIQDLLIHDFKDMGGLNITHDLLKGLSGDIALYAEMAMQNDSIYPSTIPTVQLIHKGLIDESFIPMIFEQALIMMIDYSRNDPSKEFDHYLVRLSMTQLNGLFTHKYIEEHSDLFIYPLLQIYNKNETFAFLDDYYTSIDENGIDDIYDLEVSMATIEELMDSVEESEGELTKEDNDVLIKSYTLIQTAIISAHSVRLSNYIQSNQTI